MKRGRGTNWILGAWGVLLPLVAWGGDGEQFWRRDDRISHESAVVSPRTRALGGSFAALSNGASGVYENPAGLGAQTQHEVFSDFTFDRLDDKGQRLGIMHIHVGGAVNLNALYPEDLPREKVGNQSAGLVYRYSALDYRRRIGERGGDRQGVTLGWGRSFYNGRFFVGGAVGVDRMDIRDDDGLFDHDWRRYELKVGSIYRVSRTLAVGGTVTWGIGKYDYDEMSSPLQKGEMGYLDWRIGLGYQPSRRWLLASDLSRKTIELIDDSQDAHHDHAIWRLSGGVEHPLIQNVLVLRTGLYWEKDFFDSAGSWITDAQDASGGWTAGLSYYYKDWEFTYGVDLATTGDVANTLRLEYAW